jgi:pyruvate/2-oxoglutarate dehydrogenase complex dihydrolipoamide dehydrogenase (E3) component
MAPSRLHQDPRHRPIVPLSVIVVGAGIGGLTAATALRRAGHNVKVSRPAAIALQSLNDWSSFINHQNADLYFSSLNNLGSRKK